MDNEQIQDTTSETTAPVADTTTSTEETPVAITPDEQVPAEEQLTDEEKQELSYLDKWQPIVKDLVKKWGDELLASDIPSEFSSDVRQLLTAYVDAALKSSDEYVTTQTMVRDLNKTPFNKLKLNEKTADENSMSDSADNV